MASAIAATLQQHPFWPAPAVPLPTEGSAGAAAAKAGPVTLITAAEAAGESPAASQATSPVPGGGLEPAYRHRASLEIGHILMDIGGGY